MAQIQGIRIKNYKALRDVTLGKLWNNSEEPLTQLTAVIGKNDVGKSSIFDAFGFIADCLKMGVEDACDARGGFQKVKIQENPFLLNYITGKVILIIQLLMNFQLNLMKTKDHLYTRKD